MHLLYVIPRMPSSKPVICVQSEQGSSGACTQRLILVSLAFSNLPWKLNAQPEGQKAGLLAPERLTESSLGPAPLCLLQFGIPTAAQAALTAQSQDREV